MANYWLDANIFITTKDFYHPDIAPGFWELLDHCTQHGISSPLAVRDELDKGKDALAEWARSNRSAQLWVPLDATVQKAYANVANAVKANHPTHLVADFLAGADGWLIAHAIAHGGKVTTFENRRDHGITKLKIPCVADQFRVESITVFQMMRELGVKLVLQSPAH